MANHAGRVPLMLVSNGHGEDLIGARVAAALLELRPDLQPCALPLVGEGDSYRDSGIVLLEPRKALPSGGLLAHSLPLLVADLRAGFLRLTSGQIATLARQRSHVLLVVGDVYAQALASLAHARVRFVVQPLVSVRHAEGNPIPLPNRIFMERITLPERLLMRRAERVYVRDEPTEAFLRARGISASFLGNPAIDQLQGTAPEELAGKRVAALLPGSRAYAPLSLRMMLQALELLPGVTGAVAWTGGPVELPPGWHSRPMAGGSPGAVAELFCGETKALLYEGRFAELLSAAAVAFGTAGTAHEQAAAAGVPVVAFPLPPHYTRAFLANQKRLLGPALWISAPHPGAIAEAARGLLAEGEARAAAVREGALRMGASGGSTAIARDIALRLEARGIGGQG